MLHDHSGPRADARRRQLRAHQLEGILRIFPPAPIASVRSSRGGGRVGPTAPVQTRAHSGQSCGVCSQQRTPKASTEPGDGPERYGMGGAGVSLLDSYVWLHQMWSLESYKVKKLYQVLLWWLGGKLYRHMFYHCVLLEISTG